MPFLIPDYFSIDFHAMQFKTFKKCLFVCLFFPTVFALVTLTLPCWLPVLGFSVGSQLLPSSGSWWDGARWLWWYHTAHQLGPHTELIWAISLQFGERGSETQPTHNNRGVHLLLTWGSALPQVLSSFAPVQEESCKKYKQTYTKPQAVLQTSYSHLHFKSLQSILVLIFLTSLQVSKFSFYKLLSASSAY